MKDWTSADIPINLAGKVYVINRPTQRYWAGALACVAVACLITAVYHLPANLALASQELSPAEASGTLSTWLLLHWVRVAFAIAATGLSLAAFQQSTRSA